MNPQPPLQCPVCGARFRSSRRCPRCGADLSALMLLAAQAFGLRQAGRDALSHGDAQRAHELALKAQSLHNTPRGRRLATVTRWLSHLLQRLPLPDRPVRPASSALRGSAARRTTKDTKSTK